MTYVLNKSESVRRVFRQFVVSTIKDDLEPVSEAYAEVGYKDGKSDGRFDTLCFDGFGEKMVIIEAKFDAKLLLGQGSGYLNQLTNSRSSVLMYLVPDYRIEHLWGEVKEDIAKVKSNPEFGEIETPDRRRCAKEKGGSRNLLMASWQQLLNTVMDEGDDEKNVKADIYQLRGLIEMMDTEAFEPIREGELGQAVPRRLQGLRRLIDTVVDSYGVQQGWISTGGYRATPTVDGYVRYFRLLDSNIECWIGLSYERWARNEESPLWCGLQYDSKKLLGDQGMAQIRSMLANKWLVLPDGSVRVPLNVGADFNSILDEVVSQLKEISEVVKPLTTTSS